MARSPRSQPVGISESLPVDTPPIPKKELEEALSWAMYVATKGINEQIPILYEGLSRLDTLESTAAKITATEVRVVIQDLDDRLRILINKLEAVV